MKLLILAALLQSSGFHVWLKKSETYAVDTLGQQVVQCVWQCSVHSEQMITVGVIACPMPLDL